MPSAWSGRASKACDSCRKQKTRCYDSVNSRGVCLRCDTLQQRCSLEQFSTRRPDLPANIQEATSSFSTDERLARLEKTVKRLTEHSGVASDDHRKQTASLIPQPFSRSNESTSAPPVLLIRDVASEMGVESAYQIAAPEEQTHDIVARGLISIQDATALFTLFHKHYARWVAIDESSSIEMLLPKVRKSPLLLASACLIAVRHTTQEDALRLAPFLFEEAKSLTCLGLLKSPQSIEFFQAIIVLSLWSTTIGQKPLSVDSWLLAGFAIQHCLASNLFEPILNTGPRSTFSKSEMNTWYIWNHLCLAHLHYCVGTRRTTLLGRTQLDRCRIILNSDHVTNFETRMVAEIDLYWIIYTKCSTAPIDLPGAQASLHSWKQEWIALLSQPRSQFLQMGYNFAQLLAFGESLKSGTPAMIESCLSEMVRLSAAILNLAMDTADDRTRHLTDHIYHIITFASVILCRLLNSYETQLRARHDIATLDSLVVQVVAWLRSIGLPCHVAHTLGDVVSALHKKLRPNNQSSTYASSETDMSIDTNIALTFPELIGPELYDIHNDQLWPDWEIDINGNHVWTGFNDLDPNTTG